MSLTAPTGLAAEIISSSQLLLTWNEVAGATGHRVYKNGTQVTTATSSWVDNSFDPNAVTTYEVRAIRLYFTGDQTEPEPVLEIGPAATLVIGDDEGETTIPDPPETLNVPQGLAATQTGLEEVTLTWELLTPATDIDVEIDGVVTRIASTTEYVETGIPEGTTREYRIRAVNTEASPEVVSPYTSTVSITVEPLGVPDPNVTVESSTRIIVDWAAIPGATRYDIEIDGTIIVLGDFPGALDAGLSPQQTRIYRVRAVSGTVTGQWSAPVSGTTFRSIDLSIVAQSGRQSYFPSDRSITARALEAEFNNLLALVGEAAVGSPPPDPLPPPSTMPGITDLVAARQLVADAAVIAVSWSLDGSFPTGIDASRHFYQVQVRADGAVLANTGIQAISTTGTIQIPDLPTDQDLEVRVRAVLDSFTTPTETGPWAITSVPATVAPPVDPLEVGVPVTSQGADGTSHDFTLPGSAAIGDYVVAIAFIAPTASPSGLPAGSVLATAPGGWTAEVLSGTAIYTDGPDYGIWQPVVMAKVLTSGFNTTETMTTPFDASVAFHVHLFRGLADDVLSGFTSDRYTPPFARTERTINVVEFEIPALSGTGQSFLVGGFALGPTTSLVSRRSSTVRFVMDINGVASLTTYSFADLVTLPHTPFPERWIARFTPELSYTGIVRVPFTFAYTGGDAA